MSKIYEALLRAESERGSGPVTGRDNSVAAIQDLIAAPEMDRVREELGETEPPSSFSAAIDFPVSAPEVAPITGNRRRWRPAFPVMPALEERGAAVEQFRSLRSHITEFREQRPLKTLLISSGLPGEGKSFIALNLALSFARHKGNRVLLIDGDMRRSSLDRLLGGPREPGLTEYLAGAATLEDVLQEADDLGPNSAPGLATLAFIAGGKDADNAGDLAANARFSELLQRVYPVFDWVIVDSSPVNLVSDAVSLSRSCDGVLLVGREGNTRFKTAQQAQAQFKHANVLGFVLNAVHSIPKAEYYGSYDSYGKEAS